MTEKIYTIDEIRDIVTPIAKHHHVSKMYLFGSYARGEADASSDIDLRIDAANLRSLFALGGLYADLEEALNKSLDLVTTESLRANKHDPMTRKMIRNIRKDERLLYEELSTS
ncbi:nucleotidyltransferase family protein [Fumia xinanensis]|uniref:Nucleotidyltransferase domain-containing protein n=1 Tax=Fumia xinanensis TaxID=2763659 RepID=A0A926I8B8_9FIRM|nr:nucleotidyltransferase domain-containing protein [Fumia xinanensis]MBC8560776.1 nucleotidyltransferase domain-containing protein [Fumia xinanensis]